MSQGPEKGETLKQFSVDLTELARQGKLDPTIGRDEEIKRTVQILSRRTKSNPVLLGLPGGGLSVYCLHVMLLADFEHSWKDRYSGRSSYADSAERSPGGKALSTRLKLIIVNAWKTIVIS